MSALSPVEGALHATTVETRPNAIATRANFTLFAAIHAETPVRAPRPFASVALFVKGVVVAEARVVTTVTTSSDVPDRKRLKEGRALQFVAVNRSIELAPADE